MAKTGAERYLQQRLRDPEYRAAYEAASRRIAEIDSLVQSIDDRRLKLGISKAELARRAGLMPEAVRRLLSIDQPNPTATTLVALADALGLEIVARPRRRSSAA